MRFRSLPRLLMPPIVAEARQHWRSPPLRSWQDAVEKAGSYSDELVNRFTVARGASFVAEESEYLKLLLNLVATALDEGELDVTDFGGGCGEIGRRFLTLFPRARYTVVENRTLLSLMEGLGGGVRFSEDSPERCDLFFSSGAIQYLDDPLAILDAGFGSARRAVVLARNNFCDVELFRVQKSKLFDNGFGPIPGGFDNVEISYPNRTIREAAVMGLAADHGFRCVARVEERSGILPYRGMVYGMQLAFIRERA